MPDSPLHIRNTGVKIWHPVPPRWCHQFGTSERQKKWNWDFDPRNFFVGGISTFRIHLQQFLPLSIAPLWVGALKAPLKPSPIPLFSPLICCTHALLFTRAAPQPKVWPPIRLQKKARYGPPTDRHPKIYPEPPPVHKYLWYMEVNSVKHNVTYCAIMLTLVCVKCLSALAQTLVGEQPGHAPKLQSCSTKNRKRDKQGKARETKCPPSSRPSLHLCLSAHFFHNNSCGGKGKADQLGFKPCHKI